MSNIIHVRIESKSPPLLFVEDNGGHQVARPQTITWQLVGPAAQGKFVGFEWITQTPPPNQPDGPFGPESYGVNNVSVEDDHSRLGTWIYQLRMELDGVIYSTTAELKGEVGVNNPIIINR